MQHYQNLADYMTRRALKAEANGDMDKADKCRATAAHWQNLASLAA